MAKWILGILAVVMFAMALTCHLRGKAIEKADRDRIAVDNAARAQRQQQTAGPLLIEVALDMGKLQAEAVERGEVWFILPPITWVAVGGLFAVGTAVAVWMSRRTKRPTS